MTLETGDTWTGFRVDAEQVGRMNSKHSFGALRSLLFRFERTLSGFFPGGRGIAFGSGEEKIGQIVVVNLDRQPKRWQRLSRELSRFRTSDGTPLLAITRRFSAVDARDGRAVAATSDVDTTYKIGDHLFVQPDPKLQACFDADEPVKMTRQEVAVARSHIEVWKAIASGKEDYVLVLEDDVWFKTGAMARINSAWNSALKFRREEGPNLLYFSYEDANGSAERADLSNDLFRPIRGLWFLSGYVLSRKGAEALLKAMPVVGPVDLWMNYRFEELGALALASPVILQSQDAGSDNSYSILPYLARAGTVDSNSNVMPIDRSDVGPILVWTSGNGNEGLTMALSMLGLRVRQFDQDEGGINEHELAAVLQTFDTLIDPPISSLALSKAIDCTHTKFLLEENFSNTCIRHKDLPSERTLVVRNRRKDARMWKELCDFLQLDEPIQEFPVGASPRDRVFRDDRSIASKLMVSSPSRRSQSILDDSPWVLPARCPWHHSIQETYSTTYRCEPFLRETMAEPSTFIRPLLETFPGNLALFTKEGFVHEDGSAKLVASKLENGLRPYRSGAFSSVMPLKYGRFEVEIKAASGSGLVTGFFLHRSSPRQEIDIEITGDDPTRLLANVYFNPGDEGAEMSFGYRGAPCHIDLGFDATLDFHRYAIEWRPGQISWLVDDKVVHVRVGWNPTPIPHLPMYLHGNLWVPRSQELAGRINRRSLPASASFRNVAIWALEDPSTKPNEKHSSRSNC